MNPRLLPVIGSLLLAAGCFSVEHRLPPRTYFGRLPHAAGDRVTPFERSGHKNYFLSGLFPYTGWNGGDLLQPEPGAGVRRIENLQIETEFDAFDVAVSIVPGLAYGYYVWAPRSIRVSGDEVQPRP
jgi:hypothetical protein